MASRRTILSTGKSISVTVTYTKNGEDTKQHSKEEAERYVMMRLPVKPLFNSKLVRMLHYTWGTKRPSELTLKYINVSFLPLAEPKIWWFKSALKILTSCDVHKENFIERLVHCFHKDELEKICREFAQEVSKWIARVKQVPLTNTNYNEDVKEATMKEIEDRKNTIKIAKPLAVLTKMPTVQNICRIRNMLRQLWCIRFIHKDGKRPCKRKLKSICIKPKRIDSANVLKR